MVDPDVDRSETVDAPPSGASPNGGPPGGPSLYDGSPYGGWATFGLGLVVGFVFTIIQTIVLVLYVFAQRTPDYVRGLEEVFTEAAYNGFVLAIATCATTVVCTGLVVLFASRRRGITVRDYLSLKGISIRSFAPWALGLLVLLFVLEWLTTMVDRPVVPEVILDIYRSARFAPLLWFAVIVAAPIFEETFFRGFLFRGFQHSRIGSAGTILLTSLLWASIHLQYDLWDLGIILVLGIFLGFARLKTGSIYTTVVLHALVNLIATIETVAVLS